MKIVSIFAKKLFAVHYEGESLNEYRRLMEYWGDSELVLDFLKKNQVDIPKDISIYKALDFIREERDVIHEKIFNILEDETKKLDEFFVALNDLEYQIVELSLSKGKANLKPLKCLRLYAIRIDTNMYLVTGGAIKLPLHFKMKDKPHTQDELAKLQNVKDYLKINDVFDNDSFYEYLKEQ